MDKYALIDICSNRVRMTLVRIKEKSYANPFEVFSQPTTLGSDLQNDNLIKQNTIQEIISIVKAYEKTALMNGVTKIVVAIYGFVESAKNFTSFYDHFFNSTGHVMHLIRDNDEANAIFASVISSVDQPKGMICCVTDTNAFVINYTKKAIVSYKKISLHNLIKEGLSPDDVYTRVKAEIASIDIPADFDFELPVVACGPAFRTLGKIARKVLKYPIDIEHMFMLSSEQFIAVHDCIRSLTTEKVVKIKGVSEESGKHLTVDLAIIKALIEGLNIKSFSISANGIREGLIDNLIVRPVTEKPVFDVLGNSLDNIRAFYDFDMEHSDMVYKFALILFKQLKVVHKLHRTYVKPLRVAATLFNCGKLVNFKNDSRYAFDIIVNSNVFGLSQRELVLAGFICMCQNQDNFNLSDWVKYQPMFIEADLDAVKKLGTILRLAASFAKFKTKNISDLECDILGDSVIMKTIATAPIKYEILEGMKVCNDFKKVFKKTLEII